MTTPKFPLTTFEDVLAVLVTVPVEYEVTPHNELRCVERVRAPRAIYADADGCPLNVIATAYGLPHWDKVAITDISARVWAAADGSMFGEDRALLRQACGLA